MVVECRRRRMKILSPHPLPSARAVMEKIGSLDCGSGWTFSSSSPVYGDKTRHGTMRVSTQEGERS